MTKSGKHCGKRRNCSFRAISSFVTMFSKSCLLQRRQKASIWGKGLRRFYILFNSILRFPTFNKFAANVFEDIKSKLWKLSIMTEQFLNKVEQVVAKGVIGHYEQFPFLPQSFQTSSAADTPEWFKLYQGDWSQILHTNHLATAGTYPCYGNDVKKYVLFKGV